MSYLIDAAELTHLVLECASCGTSTTWPKAVDLGSLAAHGPSCPGCGADWAETAKLYTYFRNFSTRAAELGSTVRVRFKISGVQQPSA